MRNTLEFKTPEELATALQSYNSSMCKIPDNFTVLDEYLHGLSVDEFCVAFKKLQKIITEIYDYLIENPQVIGLIKTDKKTGDLKVQMQYNISCVKKLLYVIGHFSTLNSDSLTIGMSELMNAYMTYYSNYSIALTETLKEYKKDKQNKFFISKYMRSVFRCFEMFGFEIKGLSEKLENASDIIISYPALPSIIKVIKSFAMPRICKIGFGFDFTKFNYRVFSHTSTAKLPLEDLYTFQLLSDEHKDFLSRLDKAMMEAGVPRNEHQADGFSTYVYRYRLRITQNKNGLSPAVAPISGKTMEKVHRKTKKIETYIESLPDNYQNVVAKCGGCQGNKTTDCWRRFIFIAADKKYFTCNNAWWTFPPEVDAIPHIVRAYKI